MGKLGSWNTETIHGCYKIVERIDDREVKAVCIYCGEEITIGIPALRKNNNCRNKDCSHYVDTRADVWYKGKICGHFKVLNRVNCNFAMVECLECGTISKASYTSLKKGTACCDNANCKFHKQRELKYKIGEVYNDMEIINYPKIGGNKYSVKCVKCGCNFEVRAEMFREENKRKRCLNQNCVNYHRAGSIPYLIGARRNDLECIRYAEGDNSRIILRCVDCGKEFNTLRKVDFYNGDLSCAKLLADKKEFIDLVGKQAYSLICIEDLGYDTLKCKCVECGCVQEKSKKTFKETLSGKTNSLLCINDKCKFHFRNIYSVDSTYGSYKVISRLDNGDYTVKCLECGEVLTLSRVQLYNYIQGKSLLHCKSNRRNISDLGLIVGNVYNDLKLLEMPTSISGRCKVECVKCGEILNVRGFFLLDDSLHCKNPNCCNYGKSKGTENLIGVVKNNLKGISYVNIDGKRSLKVKCLICGKERVLVGGTALYSFKNGGIKCNSIECSNSFVHISAAEYIGKVVNNLKVIDYYDDNTLKVECLNCGEVRKVLKIDLKKGDVACSNKLCVNSFKRLLDCIGSQYGDFIIEQRPKKNEIYCRCIICGHEEVFDKLPYIGMQCRFHPHKYSKHPVKIFNNLDIEKYEFTYKDLEYFTCKCQKCGIKDILNVKQMLEHNC